LRLQMAECLAAFAAPAVADQMELPASAPVLVVGWGAKAYREALARRSPTVEVQEWNVFRDQRYPAIPGRYGAVILSGVLEWCGAAELESLLAQVQFAPGALLFCQDTLLPIGVQPPPHVSLRMLALQVANGHSHAWSTTRLTASLQKLGFTVEEGKPVLAGSALIIARSPQKKEALVNAASAAD
jgi:hypothetical protein